MKMVKKLLVVVLALSLTAVYPAIAFADDDVQAQTSDSQELENENVAVKPWKEARILIMNDRKKLQENFGAFGVELEELEKQLEATDENDIDTINDLKTQIKEIKDDMSELKVGIVAKIEEMKALMKLKYSDEELKQLEKVGKSLKVSVDAVLPVENILTDKEVKFDTPPVIKNGRTLIPLRAVAEGMDADVTYDAEKHTVTIEKDGKIIELDLTKGTVLVNGETQEIDVPAEIMNNRTMVPLRFIAEQLGLKVQWEQETQTVELSE